MKRRTFMMLAGLLTWGPATAVGAASLSTIHVTIRDHAFHPRVIHARVGQPIVWTNVDQDPHTVTSGTTVDDGRWKSSPLIPDGETFTLKLLRPGSYSYFCKPHEFEDSMHGTIIVSP
jgi:plastocyanin